MQYVTIETENKTYYFLYPSVQLFESDQKNGFVKTFPKEVYSTFPKIVKVTKTPSPVKGTDYILIV
jgi:hypothetical protein